HMPAELVRAVALDVARRQGRGVEEPGLALQLGGHVVDVAVRLGRRGAAAGGEALVALAAQLVALAVIVGAERGGAQEVLRRLAVAQRQRAVARAEEAGLLGDEAAVARLDPDVRRQPAVAGAEPARDRGAEVRVGDAAVLRVAAL